MLGDIIPIGLTGIRNHALFTAFRGEIISPETRILQVEIRWELEFQLNRPFNIDVFHFLVYLRDIVQIMAI